MTIKPNNLHRVQLDGPHSKGRKPARSSLAHTVKRVLQLVAVVVLLVIWTAVSLDTQERNQGVHQRTTVWTEAA